MKKIICFFLGHRWAGWVQEFGSPIQTRHCARCFKVDVSSVVPEHPNCRHTLAEHVASLEQSAVYDPNDLDFEDDDPDICPECDGPMEPGRVNCFQCAYDEDDF